MRPIELTLSGLQSYREQQVIDFTKLCENGLFGIFGPTGSGKSTILDAITLALYGKVERALNGTQGIMNQAEDQLAVSFTFSLNGAQESRAFRVERRFKRTGEITISNAVSRFIEISEDGERVLADKLSDVTRLVEHHIGLKMDDFTRAVVLPQGKFAEFLSLKGSDRRQMLQRLFSLERYGDELGAKLARRVKEAEAEVNTCLAEQQGLGNASAEALAQAEQELQAAIKRHEAARAAKAAAEAHYKALEELRGWQDERLSVVQQLQQLEGEAASISERERQLRLAAEAEQLLPLIAEARSTAQALKLAEERLAQAEAARQSAELKLEAAAHAAEAAKRERETREPMLLNRIAQLKQAVEWEQDAAKQQQDADRLDAERLQAEQQAASANLELQKLKLLLEKAAQRQSELKQQLTAVERPFAEREGSQAAWLDSERLREQKAALQQLGEAHAAQARARAEAETEFQQLMQGLIDWSAVILEWRDNLKAAAFEWKRLDSSVEHLLEGVDASLAWTTQQHREMTKRALAAELAHTLQDGEACPVCGSTMRTDSIASEPDAAHGHTHRYSEWSAVLEQQLERWTKLREDLNRIRTDIRSSEAGYQRMRDELLQRLQAADHRMNSFTATDAEEGYAQLAAAMTSTSTTEAVAVSQGEGSATADEVCSAVEDQSAYKALDELRSFTADPAVDEADGDRLCSRVEHVLQLAEHCCNHVRQLFERLSQQSDAYSVQKSGFERHVEQQIWALQEVGSRCRTMKQTAEEAVKRLEEQRELCENLRSSFGQRFPQWPLADMEQLRDRWLRMDQEAEDCRNRLDRGVKYVEETQQKIKEQEDHKQQAERLMLQREAELKGSHRMLEDLYKRLTPLLAEGLLADQLKLSEHNLSSIKQAAEQSGATAEAARLAAAEAVKAYALAEQARVSAEERKHTAATSLQTMLAESSFAHESEAESARLGMEAKQGLEQAIIAYRERQTELHTHLRRLDGLLQSRAVSDEEWEMAVASRNQIMKEDEEAFTARVKAERDAEELRGKHARWMELEARREEKQLLHSRLQQLQSVFRGNAFVEYVAEEQLLHVSRAASVRLKELTKQRYALEVDSGGGFVIRDDGNGGIRRPVSTLSGGETFLTSLSLALALSAQIQLRGMYPLEFFFLDEGFGTLDPELLDTVVTALEKLHSDHLAVGVISHVAELRARLPRKLVVQPAEQAGKGSTLSVETL